MNKLLISQHQRKLLLVALMTLFNGTAQANDPWSSDRKWLFGDWDGNRQQLEQKGYKFNFSVMNQSAVNFDGGYNDDQELLNAYQLTLGANFDLEKILNWQNTQASLMITKRDGQSLASERIGDPRAAQLSSVQEIYGRGQSWRLSQAWLKKGFIDNTLTFKIGRMGMSEDFNASQCEFQNLVLCGGQIGKAVGSIWYNSPVSVWGANVKYQFSPTWTMGIGVYEVNPENALEKHGFNLSMDDTEGALIPIELTWKPKLTLFNNLAGEYKLGAFYSTADATDVKTNNEGEISLNPSDRTIHSSKHSFWFNAQQQLTQKGSNSSQGLYGTINLTFNDKATNSIQDSQQVAFWYKGLLDNRPNDSIGFGLARYAVNDRIKDLRIYSNDINSLTTEDYSNLAYKPLQNDEIDVELNYSYQWSPSIMLRPNIQYVYQSGGVKEVDDAWVAGLSVKLNF
ncbi:carbohydrate porin [Acinetobacter baumannii]|uniref:carbohydrate porin n=1 Tax=Acinetobacter baumannii TaxID=470 RepID=UPI0002BB599B